MAALFGRVVVVEFVRDGDVVASVRDLQCEFSVELSDTSEPNRCTATLYNLAEGTIKAAQAEGTLIRLTAGYIGSERVIFEGGIAKTRRGRGAADQSFTVTAFDGGTVRSQTMVSQSFASEVTATDLIDEIATVLGYSVIVLGSPPALSYPLGYVLSGSAGAALDTIVASIGARWSAQNSTIVVVHGTGADDGPPPLVSVGTGMIGSPEITDEDSSVDVRSLLLPDLTPGRRFRIESRDVTGAFIARKVTHAGSLYGPDFTTTVSGEAA